MAMIELEPTYQNIVNLSQRPGFRSMVHNLAPEYCWDLWGNMHFRLSFWEAAGLSAPSGLWIYWAPHSHSPPLASPTVMNCLNPRDNSWRASWMKPSLPFLAREPDKLLLHALLRMFYGAWISRLSANATPFLHTFVKFSLLVLERSTDRVWH